MPPGGEGSLRATLPGQLSPAGEESTGAGSKSPARPRGTPGRGPASWQPLAVGGRRGRQLHVGRQVSLGRWSRGGAPQRQPLCACWVGDGESGDGESGDGGLVWERFPTTTHLLPGPGSAWVFASLSETPPLSKLTRLVSWQRRPCSGLNSRCSLSDKGFLAYLLMASHNTLPVPLHPLLSDNTFMECLSPNECVERNGGAALLGELGDIWTL